MAAIPWILDSLKKAGVRFKETHHSEVFMTAQVAEKGGRWARMG